LADSGSRADLPGMPEIADPVKPIQIERNGRSVLIGYQSAGRDTA